MCTKCTHHTQQIHCSACNSYAESHQSNFFEWLLNQNLVLYLKTMKTKQKRERFTVNLQNK